MGRQRQRQKQPARGLFLKNGIWHIDKRIRGRRLCESTRTGNRREAEAHLARRMEEIRQASVFGVRPQRTFREAATKYLNECIKRSLERDARALNQWDRFIGELPLDRIHMDTLMPFIQQRKAEGVKARTVNRELAVIRRVLNLAARRWRDEHNLSWLVTAPLIEMQDWQDAGKPYPLDWDEQRRFFAALPPHLTRMALFKVNVGAREQEVCRLRWDWEIPVPQLGTTVFYVPDDPSGEMGVSVKNKEDRILVLNAIARSVIDSVRGEHPEHVFTYRGHPVTRMYNGAWRRARKRTGLPVRVHDLKHTFGRRLRAAGVPLETRRVLLGHKSRDITTHYSAAEIAELIDAAEKVAGDGSRKTPELTLLKLRRSA